MKELTRTHTRQARANALFGLEIVLDVILQVLAIIDAFAALFGIDLSGLFNPDDMML